MLASLSYKERNTLLQRLDPRTRILFMLLLLVGIYLVWDLRIVLVFTALALAQYVLSGLTWRETGKFWLFSLLLGTVWSLLTLFTGGAGIPQEIVQTQVWQGQLFGWTITFTDAQIWYAVTQFIRIVTMASLSIVPIFTINPAFYGVAFRKLGLSDNISFALDLSFRFLPSLASDFVTTLDAQRARGYEIERAGGLLKAIRNTAPLVLPITIGAILKSEDVIDAMNLHAFGTGKRTWLQELHYRAADYAIIAVAATLCIGVIILRFGGLADFWLP
ncbi:MAG: energy-coupling factor transporter transmembrane protein EcfT [Chloroflexaceae bacterium]|jgi:energy-coupling factor transport system permease protein|nr:energy-coupling factor transporter transmembrane protein EcfT [Chloroflexaceae bacterium]